jgi:arylsulfatase A-like enzyme
VSEPHPSPPNSSPTGGGKGEGRGAIRRSERARRLQGYIIALVALAAWYALRFLPGDITPEIPETTLRQTAYRGAAPKRLWQQPQPFPTYDPTIAYSFLDHLDQATLSCRRAPDADLLRRDLTHLRDQLSSRWLSASGDWRVAGDGVLSCFSPPAESDRFAAALRPVSEQAARVSTQARFLTPPQPEERAGLTPGLDSHGSGLAFLFGWSGPDTLSCEWVRLNEYRPAQVLSHEELGVANPGGDQLTSWLTLALTFTAEGAGRTHGGWQATINGRPLSAAPATALPPGRPGVLLQSQGMRIAFADFSLNDAPTDSDLAEPLARLIESLRLADLLGLPGDPNFQFRPEGERRSADGHPVQQVEIAGVARAALAAPAPSAAEFPLPPLSGPCRLQAWVGLHPASWQQSGAFARPDLRRSEVRVRVALRMPAGEQELWSATFGPEPPGGQPWIKVDVPLPAPASPLGVGAPGEPVSLSLRAEGASPGETEVPGGYVVWANPVIRLPAASKSPSNVILVIIDALRADALDRGSQRQARTPSFDRLAKESLCFENAFAQSPWCVPSLATLYSSLWPEVHGADPPDFRTPGSLSPAAVTLAEALRYAGYHTSLLTDQPYPERVNLEQGFEEVVNTSAMRSPLPSALFVQAAGQADGGLDRPFFLCLHTHHLAQAVAQVLLEPPMNLDRLREKLHARYFGELEVLDQALGEFLASLQSHGRLEDTLLIVTADHGIDLSDRYPTIIPAGAGFTLRDEQLHVPLFMRAPAGLLAPRQVPVQVRLIDLAPTVCDLLGLALPADWAPTQWAGESLMPVLRQGADLADRPVFASACFLPPERAAVRWRGYKYIRVLNPEEPRGEPFLEPLDNEQLYNTSTDPGETENLTTKAPALLAEMRALLLAHLEEGARQRLALFPEAAPQSGAAPSAGPGTKASPASAAKGGERQ